MDTAQQLADIALQQQKLAHLSFGQRAYAQAAEAFSLAAKHFSSAVTRLGSNQEAGAARSKSVWRQHAIECLSRVISIHEGYPQHLARAEKDLADLYDEQSDFETASDHYLNAAYNYALIKNNNMNRGCMIKVADLRALLECYDRSTQIYEQVASELDNMHKYDMPELLFKAGLMRLLLQDMEQVDVAFEKYCTMSPYFAQSRKFTLLTKMRQAFANQSTELLTSAIVEYDTGACLNSWYQIMLLRIKQVVTSLKLNDLL